MTKLKYPKDSLVDLTNSNFNFAVNSIENMKSKSTFNIPDDFSQKEYLLNLPKKIDSYISTIQNIKNSIVKIQSNIDSNNILLKTELESLVETEILANTRLVK